MNIDTTAQSDLGALTALNRDYIKSVQDGDVRRFDEILAEDRRCSVTVAAIGPGPRATPSQSGRIPTHESER